MNNGTNYQPQLVSRISEPSTIVLTKGAAIAQLYQETLFGACGDVECLTLPSSHSLTEGSNVKENKRYCEMITTNLSEVWASNSFFLLAKMTIYSNTSNIYRNWIKYAVHWENDSSSVLPNPIFMINDPETSSFHDWRTQGPMLLGSAICPSCQLLDGASVHVYWSKTSPTTITTSRKMAFYIQQHFLDSTSPACASFWLWWLYHTKLYDTTRYTKLYSCPLHVSIDWINMTQAPQWIILETIRLAKL